MGALEPALGNGSFASSVGRGVSSSAGGARLLLGDAVAQRDVDVTPTLRVYGLPYPWHPHIHSTYEIVGSQVISGGHVDALEEDVSPFSAGRGGDLIFSDSTFPGPAVFEQQ